MVNTDRPEKDWYRRNLPKRPNYHRRAVWNDYQQPRIYMITMVKGDQTPPLSEISGDRQHIILTKTPVGLLVEQVLAQWSQRWPEFKIDNCVIMPDHIHFILNVTAPLTVTFAKLIVEFKGDCTRLFRSRFPESAIAINGLPFFQKNFHDRILGHRGQLAAMHRYLDDNPRRYLLKKLNPDLFARVNFLKIGDEAYSAYGNLFLLREIEKTAVIIRSHYSPQEVAGLKETWRQSTERGGVLVSPFISDKEKAVMEESLAVGGRVIVIRDNGFPERFKPSGKLFDYCLGGQLLLIGPTTYETSRSFLTREKCWEMNRMAEKICSISPGTFVTLRARSEYPER